MMDWLQWLFRRKPNSKAPAVEEAEKVKQAQFGEWDSVLQEVERVQSIAQGESRPAKHP